MAEPAHRSRRAQHHLVAGRDAQALRGAAAVDRQREVPEESSYRISSPRRRRAKVSAWRPPRRVAGRLDPERRAEPQPGLRERARARGRGRRCRSGPRRRRGRRPARARSAASRRLSAVSEAGSIGSPPRPAWRRRQVRRHGSEYVAPVEGRRDRLEPKGRERRRRPPPPRRRAARPPARAGRCRGPPGSARRPRPGPRPPAARCPPRGPRPRGGRPAACREARWRARRPLRHLRGAGSRG